MYVYINNNCYDAKPRNNWTEIITITRYTVHMSKYYILRRNNKSLVIAASWPLQCSVIIVFAAVSFAPSRGCGTPSRSYIAVHPWYHPSVLPSFSCPSLSPSTGAPGGKRIVCPSTTPLNCEEKKKTKVVSSRRRVARAFCVRLNIFKTYLIDLAL